MTQSKRNGNEMRGDDRLLTIAELKTRIGVKSDQTVYSWMKKGLLPKKRRIALRRVGWLNSEIQAFIASREAA